MIIEADKSKICKANILVWMLLLRILFYSEKGQSFVLFKPSTDWMQPTHIMEGNLLYWAHQFKR